MFLLNVFVVFGNFNSYFVSSNSVCNHTCDWKIGFPLRGRQILLITRMITDFITPILKSPVVPVIWFALIGAMYSRITPFFAFFTLHLFPAKKKMSKTLIPPPQKWMNLISNQPSTTSIKYLNWPNPVFGRFQNGCNKVVIEPCVVQFWSEIILVISNWTRTARSFDFEITCMILAQIALHSVQLPLWIGLHSVLLPLLIS